MTIVLSMVFLSCTIDLTVYIYHILYVSQLKHSDSEKHSSTDAYSGLQRVSDVNKTFLQNTIRSVESHNRREVRVVALVPLYCCV